MTAKMTCGQKLIRNRHIDVRIHSKSQPFSIKSGWPKLSRCLLSKRTMHGPNLFGEALSKVFPNMLLSVETLEC